MVPDERDKAPVIALREIAERYVTPDALEDDVITRLQRFKPTEGPPAEKTDFGDFPVPETFGPDPFSNRRREDPSRYEDENLENPSE